MRSWAKAVGAAVSLPLLFILSACASVQQNLDPEVFYRRDMDITMDGLSGNGVLVVPAAKRHVFSVKAKAPMDFYTFNTCHREYTYEGLPQKVDGFFTPVEGIEDQGGCVTEFGAYDKKGGKHAWGFVEYQTPDAVLPATLGCNGDRTRYPGVSLCQSRAGLYQTLDFDVDVWTSPLLEPACGPQLKSPDRRHFEFKIPPGRCTFRFQDPLTQRQHRLTTLGYEMPLIRQE